MTMIRTIRPNEELPREIGAAILALSDSIWPPEGFAKPNTVEEAIAKWAAQGSAHFVIGEGDAPVLAHALIFRREITTSQGQLPVGALASVCVHPHYRGRGWGADVVRAAFDFLPELGAKVSLFQTGVPPFYEKLGGRIVTNPFNNGSLPGNPFWDNCEMIYPASFPWPDGDIDLNGPGY